MLFKKKDDFILSDSQIDDLFPEKKKQKKKGKIKPLKIKTKKYVPSKPLIKKKGELRTLRGQLKPNKWR